MNLKAGYGYIFFRCLSNYLSVVCARIEIRLVCKISIVTIPELTKTISDQATMLSYAGGCVADSSNVIYIRFNLPELSSIADSTNSDGCYLPVTTKISNFLYGIQYPLFKIVSRKISSPTKSEYLLSYSSSSASDSFDLQYREDTIYKIAMRYKVYLSSRLVKSQYENYYQTKLLATVLLLQSHQYSVGRCHSLNSTAQLKTFVKLSVKRVAIFKSYRRESDRS